MRLSRLTIVRGSGGLAIVVAVVAATVRTPHDPGEFASCGSLAAGGFTDLYFACEQTRGVYRATVLLGLVLGMALLTAGAIRRPRVRLALGVLAGLTLVVAAWLAIGVLVGDPLTYRWVGVFPVALVLTSTPGMLTVFSRSTRG